MDTRSPVVLVEKQDGGQPGLWDGDTLCCCNQAKSCPSPCRTWERSQSACSMLEALIQVPVSGALSKTTQVNSSFPTHRPFLLPSLKSFPVIYHVGSSINQQRKGICFPHWGCYSLPLHLLVSYLLQPQVLHSILSRGFISCSVSFKYVYFISPPSFLSSRHLQFLSYCVPPRPFSANISKSHLSFACIFLSPFSLCPSNLSSPLILIPVPLILSSIFSPSSPTHSVSFWLPISSWVGRIQQWNF